MADRAAPLVAEHLCAAFRRFLVEIGPSAVNVSKPTPANP
jgi:hypothetical protein